MLYAFLQANLGRHVLFLPAALVLQEYVHTFCNVHKEISYVPSRALSFFVILYSFCPTTLGIYGPLAMSQQNLMLRIVFYLAGHAQKCRVWQDQGLRYL